MSYTPAERGARRADRYRPGERVLVVVDRYSDWCEVIEQIDPSRLRVRYPSGGNLIVPAAWCNPHERPESTRIVS